MRDAVTTPQTKAGQTVWCRTADGEWWKTVAAGPATRSIGQPAWLSIPVLGWDPDNPKAVVNWPVDAVNTSDPSRPACSKCGSALPPCDCGESVQCGEAWCVDCIAEGGWS